MCLINFIEVWKYIFNLDFISATCFGDKTVRPGQEKADYLKPFDRNISHVHRLIDKPVYLCIMIEFEKAIFKMLSLSQVKIERG